MKLIISWILRVIVTLLFLLASFGKITGNPEVVTMFENWGYPDGFYLITGIIELILAILLVIPKTLKIALTGLGVVMAAAMITHIINDPIIEIVRPLIFMVLLGIIFFLQPKRHSNQ